MILESVFDLTTFDVNKTDVDKALEIFESDEKMIPKIYEKILKECQKSIEMVGDDLKRFMKVNKKLLRFRVNNYARDIFCKKFPQDEKKDFYFTKEINEDNLISATFMCGEILDIKLKKKSETAIKLIDMCKKYNLQYFLFEEILEGRKYHEISLYDKIREYDLIFGYLGYKR